MAYDHSGNTSSLGNRVNHMSMSLLLIITLLVALVVAAVMRSRSTVAHQGPLPASDFSASFEQGRASVRVGFEIATNTAWVAVPGNPVVLVCGSRFYLGHQPQLKTTKIKGHHDVVTGTGFTASGEAVRVSATGAYHPEQSFTNQTGRQVLVLHVRLKVPSENLPIAGDTRAHFSIDDVSKLKPAPVKGGGGWIRWEPTPDLVIGPEGVAEAQRFQDLVFEHGRKWMTDKQELK